MKITDIKFRKYYPDGLLRAIISLTFDDELALHDIKIITSRDKLLLVMPSRKNSEGLYKDIAHPINSEFRSYIEITVFEKFREYEKEMKEAESAQEKTE